MSTALRSEVANVSVDEPIPLEGVFCWGFFTLYYKIPISDPILYFNEKAGSAIKKSLVYMQKMVPKYHTLSSFHWGCSKILCLRIRSR